MRIRPSIFLLALTTLAGCQLGQKTTAIELRPSPQEVVVENIPRESLEAFDRLEGPQRSRAVLVRVDGTPPDLPSVAGETSRRGTTLIFTPRYPFQHGTRYLLYLASPISAEHPTLIAHSFSIAAPPQTPAVRISAIYPSADELPENTLKFYIHFSGPMSRGEAYRHIKLLDASGRPVPFPFLELGEELWNSDMTRFTLFFDPGRIKTGLVPNQELGLALEAGRTYTLAIDPAWKDGENRPLAEAVRRSFRVVPMDSVQPSPARWKVDPPTAGTRAALVVTFDEPLDHALLERLLAVRDGTGAPVSGTITISDQERRWSFVPEAPWRAGQHTLVAESILEDRAGNSIGRPFEVNLNRQVSPSEMPPVEIRFTVAP